jgi:hypothetical protein
MNDRRNSLPQDVLSFGPFSVFAAERLLKKADDANKSLAWPSAAAAQYWSDYSEGHVISAPAGQWSPISCYEKQPGTCRGFFRPPEAIDLLPIDKTEVHTK